MSISWKLRNCDQDDLVEFLAEEYAKDSGIPVHLYSIVNATFTFYNGGLALTDNIKGTLIFEGQQLLTSYGDNDPLPMVRALSRCEVNIECLG